jgi:hypothetical protein
VSLTCLLQQHWFGCFKHFNPLFHTSLWQAILSLLGIPLSMDLCPLHSFRHQKPQYCMLLVLGANL